MARKRKKKSANKAKAPEIEVKQAASQPEPEPAPKAEVAAEPAPAPKAEVAAEPAPAPKAEVAAEPAPAPKAAPKPQPRPKARPRPRPASAPAPAPTAPAVQQQQRRTAKILNEQMVASKGQIKRRKTTPILLGILGLLLLVVLVLPQFLQMGEQNRENEDAAFVAGLASVMQIESTTTDKSLTPHITVMTIGEDGSFAYPKLEKDAYENPVMQGVRKKRAEGSYVFQSTLYRGKTLSFFLEDGKVYWGHRNTKAGSASKYVSTVYEDRPNSQNPVNV